MSKVAVLKLRNKLKSDLEIIKTIDILKEIAVSEYRFMEDNRRQAGVFLDLIESFFRFYKNDQFKESRYFKNTSKRSAVVAVTSDEGFLGFLNNQMIERVVQFREKNPDCEVAVLGRRGARRMTELGIPALELSGIPFPLDYQDTAPLKAYLMDAYVRNQIGSATIIYAHCHSMTHQTVESLKILPFHMAEHGQGTGSQFESRLASDRYVVIEPDFQHLVEYTVALWFGRKLYEIFWDCKLSEVACRAIELNERIETLTKQRDKTRMRYFRSNHEVIDAEIRDIFASHHFSQKAKKRVGVEK